MAEKNISSQFIASPRNFASSNTTLQQSSSVLECLLECDKASDIGGQLITNSGNHSMEAFESFVSSEDEISSPSRSSINVVQGQSGSTTDTVHTADEKTQSQPFPTTGTNEEGHLQISKPKPAICKEKTSNSSSPASLVKDQPAELNKDKERVSDTATSQKNASDDLLDSVEEEEDKKDLPGGKEPFDPSPEGRKMLEELFPCSSPAHPNMGSSVKRLETFTLAWPCHKIAAAKEDFAIAGLFFLDMLHRVKSDRVKCFYCDGGLKNWKANDDPFTEHAKWYPGCEFVLQRKGVDFVKNAVARHPNLKRPIIAKSRFDVGSGQVVDAAPSSPRASNAVAPEASVGTTTFQSSQNDVASTSGRRRSLESLNSCAIEGEALATDVCEQQDTKLMRRNRRKDESLTFGEHEDGFCQQEVESSRQRKRRKSSFSSSQGTTSSPDAVPNNPVRSVMSITIVSYPITSTSLEESEVEISAVSSPVGDAPASTTLVTCNDPPDAANQ